jgi:hypothetical protein
MFKTDVQKLRNALEFTRVYKENATTFTCVKPSAWIFSFVIS